MILRRRLGEIDGVDVAGFRFSGGNTDSEVMSFGAALTRLARAVRFGTVADIVLCYDDLANYATAPAMREPSVAGTPIASRKAGSDVDDVPELPPSGLHDAPMRQLP